MDRASCPAWHVPPWQPRPCGLSGVLAYLTGMSSASWFAAYHHGAPAGGLNAAADQQIAVAILWAVPTLGFLPVLYVTVIVWLGSASSAGSDRLAASGSAPAGCLRPPRGWRSPHTR